MPTITHSCFLFSDDILGICFIVSSVVIFARTAAFHSTLHYTPKQLVALFMSTQFIVYLIVQVLLIWIFLGMVHTTEVYKWRGKMTESLLKPLVKRLRHQERRQVSSSVV